MNSSPSLIQPIPQRSKKMSAYDNPTSKKRLLLGLVGLIALGTGCAYLFKDLIIEYGQWTVEQFGLEGILFFTMLIDSSPLPLTSEPLVLLALGAKINPVNLALGMSLFSHLGCLIGWSGGQLLARNEERKKWVINRFPELFDYMDEYGARGVLLGALLPIPYAITTWAAGVTNVPLKDVFIASSGRWVKNCVTVALITGGWMLGGS